MPSPAYAVQSRPRLRLWPGVAIVLLQWFGRFGLPAIDQDLAFYGVFAGIGGGLGAAHLVAVLQPRRLGGPPRRARRDRRRDGRHVAVPRRLDRHRGDGHASSRFWPCRASAWPSCSGRSRRATCRRCRGECRWLAALLLACGVWTLIRTGGFTGSFDNDLSWRWTPTAGGAAAGAGRRAAGRRAGSGGGAGAGTGRARRDPGRA